MNRCASTWTMLLLVSLLLPACDEGGAGGCATSRPRNHSPCSTLGQKCEYAREKQCPCGPYYKDNHWTCLCFLYKGEQRWSCDLAHDSCYACKDGAVAEAGPDAAR